MSPDPMVPVKVGVIGIGNMGWHHARVLSLLRDADLVGVADPDAERGKLATEQFGCRWFADYNAMLSEVEAVCIAVPTLLHHPVGLACLRAGVHVLIEKPIAASQDEATALIEAASAAGCLLQVGHIERFNPAFRVSSPRWWPTKRWWFLRRVATAPTPIGPMTSLWCWI